MGATGISKSAVSRLIQEIDERVNAFLNRPIEGEFPYLWLDATYIKSRQGGRIVSTATIIAVGVSNDGRDRKSVVWGKRVSVRVDLVGRRIIKKTNNITE